ncbi:sugar-transfer associated ATP-grasp domain-containing protein [Kaarinaea lacus]
MRSLSQFFKRWQSARRNLGQVLSMNERNLHYVYPHNHRRDFPVADNKLLTKEIVDKLDVPIPQTYFAYSYFYELRNLRADLERHSDFVIKPASGSGGGGIIVIAGRQGDHWVSVGGTQYTLQDLRKHISDIIFGVYSFGLQDHAIIESRIVQHADIDALSPFGLADVRLILCRHEPVLAMIRLATKASNGTANLHQGAIGVGVDIASGTTSHASFKGKAVEIHPDSQASLINRKIPFWGDVLRTAEKVARSVPLKYIGVDIAVSENGPRLLEINARPGIEIQNANQQGMRAILEAIG